jgi:hypothetical protein
LFPHVAAAIKLNVSGAIAGRGGNIEYIYTDLKHTDPEAGPFLNSDEFMHGYNDGFDACSDENESKTPVMTSQRATYIINVCTGRILNEDLSVDGYCFGIQLCLPHKSMAECYTDLKNGEIENWSIFG